MSSVKIHVNSAYGDRADKESRASSGSDAMRGEIERYVERIFEVPAGHICKGLCMMLLVSITVFLWLHCTSE